MTGPEGRVVIIDLDLLATMIRERRGDRSFRELESESGVDYATLHRFETRARGRTPSLWTFACLCAWLEVSPAIFLPNTPDTATPAPEPPTFAASPQRPTERMVDGWADHIERLPMSAAKRWTRKLLAELHAERARLRASLAVTSREVPHA